MGDSFPRVTAALVQAAPVVLDRERTLDRLDALYAESRALASSDET